MNPASAPETIPSGASPDAGPGATLGAWAHRALVKEVELSPKPGLVDRFNTGAHRDMDLGTFLASARAIAPWFPRFYRLGEETRDREPRETLRQLRSAGMACEGEMFAATGGVNTHKGSIFSLGLLCGAAGRRGGVPGREALCGEVALLCGGMVEAELAANPTPRTSGEHSYRSFGLTGARGEAASGFATVRQVALPVYEGILAAGGGEEGALLGALVHLMAVNEDTNLVHRGGREGLLHVQSRARALLEAGTARVDLRERLADLDEDLIRRNLSPGGSADLLALTWFLAQFPG